jgi:hypothetical protein
MEVGILFFQFATFTTNSSHFYQLSLGDYYLTCSETIFEREGKIYSFLRHNVPFKYFRQSMRLILHDNSSEKMSPFTKIQSTISGSLLRYIMLMISIFTLRHDSTDSSKFFFLYFYFVVFYFEIATYALKY